MNLNNDLIVTVISLLVIIIVGVLFTKKIKFIKYSAWAIGLLLFVNLVVIIPLTLHYNKEASKYLVGTYYLIADSSKCANLDMHKFDSVIMIVKDDNTFTINKNVPFFPISTGKWSYWMDGELETIQGTFTNNDKKLPISFNSNSWIFGGGLLLNGKKGDRIYFKRK